MSGEMDVRKNAEEATAASPEMCEDAPSGSAWGKTPCEGIAADETASPSARAMTASPKTRENASGGSARKDSPPSRSASREAAALLSMRPGETDAASSKARRDLSGDRAGEKSLVEPAASAIQSPEAAAPAAPEVLLRPGERLDDLQWGGLRLIQRPDAFRFGTDSVLLADFAAPKRTDRAADLGCGTGAIATLMAAHCPGLRVDAVEIQPEIADMARRSVALNHMEEQICVHEGDLRDCWRALGAQSRTLVVCNPPYGRDGSALTSRSETTRIGASRGRAVARGARPGGGAAAAQRRALLRGLSRAANLRDDARHGRLPPRAQAHSDGARRGGPRAEAGAAGRGEGRRKPAALAGAAGVARRGRRIYRRMAENLPGGRGAGKRLKCIAGQRRSPRNANDGRAADTPTNGGESAGWTRSGETCPPPRIPYRIHRKVLDRIALEEYNRLNRWGRRKAEMGIARSLGT